MQHQGHTQFKEKSIQILSGKTKGQHGNTLSHIDWSCYNSCCILVLHPASQWAEISGMTGISIHSIKKKASVMSFSRTPLFVHVKPSVHSMILIFASNVTLKQ